MTPLINTMTVLTAAAEEGHHIPVVDPGAADGVFALLWLVIALPLAGAAVLLRRWPLHRHVGSPARRPRCRSARSCSAWRCSSGCSAATPRSARSVSTCTRGSRPGSSASTWTCSTTRSRRCSCCSITGVGSLIHVYSIGYMEHDPRRRRFFGYLNLFVAAMLMLVLADNYLGLFLGWEGVGLASYLLIGFWQHKHTAAAAAKKAFVINRVGDIGLSLGDRAALRHLRHDLVRADLGRVGRGVGEHADRHRPAAPARRLRQVRPGAAAGLAARRDGGPDPGLGADPRGDDGDGRRLPGRAVQLHLRAGAGAPRPWS